MFCSSREVLSGKSTGPKLEAYLNLLCCRTRLVYIFPAFQEILISLPHCWHCWPDMGPKQEGFLSRDGREGTFELKFSVECRGPRSGRVTKAAGKAGTRGGVCHFRGGGGCTGSLRGAKGANLPQVFGAASLMPAGMLTSHPGGLGSSPSSTPGTAACGCAQSGSG